jgi:hypothetical protein
LDGIMGTHTPIVEHIQKPWGNFILKYNQVTNSILYLYIQYDKYVTS